MVRGRSMTSRRRRNQAARSDERGKEAQSERRFSMLKGQDRVGRSGPAGRTPRRAAIAKAGAEYNLEAS